MWKVDFELRLEGKIRNLKTKQLLKWDGSILTVNQFFCVRSSDDAHYCGMEFTSTLIGNRKIDRVYFWWKNKTKFSPSCIHLSIRQISSSKQVAWKVLSTHQNNVLLTKRSGKQELKCDAEWYRYTFKR